MPSKNKGKKKGKTIKLPPQSNTLDKLWKQSMNATQGGAAPRPDPTQAGLVASQVSAPIHSASTNLLPAATQAALSAVASHAPEEDTRAQGGSDSREDNGKARAEAPNFGDVVVVYQEVVDSGSSTTASGGARRSCKRRRATTPSSTTSESPKPVKGPRYSLREQLERTLAALAKEPSTWRESRIDEKATITKILAEERYKIAITTAMLKDWGITATDLGEGKFKYEIPERLVERVAWTKYQSPEGFEHVLDTRELAHRRNLRTRGTAYPRPFAYPSKFPVELSAVVTKRIPAAQRPVVIPPTHGTSNALGRGTPMQHNLPGPSAQPSVLPATAGASRVPRGVRTAFERTFPGQDWVLDACAACLEPDGVQCDRIHLLYQLVHNRCSMSLGSYPTRPGAHAPKCQTPSFKSLPALLSQAPARSDQRAPRQAAPPGITAEVLSDYSVKYGWNAEYKNEIFRALISIMQHDGADAWRQARWLVYDKYRECVDGVKCILYRGNVSWVDSAYCWLIGHYDGPDCSESRRTELLWLRGTEYGRKYSELLQEAGVAWI